MATRVHLRQPSRDVGDQPPVQEEWVSFTTVDPLAVLFSRSSQTLFLPWPPVSHDRYTAGHGPAKDLLQAIVNQAIDRDISQPEGRRGAFKYVERTGKVTLNSDASPLDVQASYKMVVLYILVGQIFFDFTLNNFGPLFYQ